MLYFVFARLDTRTKTNNFRRYKLDALMPHLGQLRISTVPVVHLARSVRQARPVFIYLHAILNYPGLIFPQKPFADAGGTHHPPNLATSLKEKR